MKLVLMMAVKKVDLMASSMAEMLVVYWADMMVL